MLHAGGRRRRGQRILYFFRTPPGVRVGRAPIDEDAIRLLEQHNPDVEFDWNRLLQGAEGGGAEDAEPGWRARGAERTERAEGAERRSRSKGADRAERPERGARGERREGRREEPRSVPPFPVPSAPLDSADTSAPSAIQAPSDSADTSTPSAPSPLSAVIGRLRARYAEILARIAEQDLDDESREQLKARAGRLNPDAWVTADEVDAALEQYETIFEELRAQVGRHARGRRPPPPPATDL